MKKRLENIHSGWPGYVNRCEFMGDLSLSSYFGKNAQKGEM